MTLEPSLHKERVDFSHYYPKIRIKCPECVRTIKGLNHVRVYDNIPGLWRHIRQEHGEISNLQFTTERIKGVLKNVVLAMEWEMLPDYDKKVTTTTLSMIYDGRPARSDVRDKLKEIARIMKCQSSMYPNFRTDNVFAYIKVVLGNPDKRTSKKYFDCIISHSAKNCQNGTYDVTAFCENF